MTASGGSVRRLLAQNSAVLRRGAEHARQQIFGHVPILEGAAAGNKTAKKTFTGPYLEKYYPTSINHHARKVHDGWETEQEEYRRVKLTQRRRKGKGPPKKGAGARSGKKR
ncbi:unnamed protein product [Pseudo-nitzschia multistriata]|uniref:Small ribosomal subunit protein mS33 n=1 Tax=Pseudo-nitzschia multistriata TaxID=183589 RepID=A0A448YVS8_9STRA|nr:unnamed protein product [Pseudo-nitzschia multistriata]